MKITPIKRGAVMEHVLSDGNPLLPTEVPDCRTGRFLSLFGRFLMCLMILALNGNAIGSTIPANATLDQDMFSVSPSSDTEESSWTQEP